MYLDELITLRLVPAFRSDHSLIGLLWGVKGRGARKHKPESAVQAAVYGLLHAYADVPLAGAREPEELDAKKPDLRLSFFLEGGSVVALPIEIKWSDNRQVWTAIKQQLLAKYMTDPHINHGVYVVAWSGLGLTKASPSGVVPTSASQMREELENVAAAATQGIEKKVVVHVIDVSVSTG